MKQISEEEAHEVLVRGVNLVGGAFSTNGSQTVPMIISGLMAICSQMGALHLLRESLEAAISTIDLMVATTEAEAATKQ